MSARVAKLFVWVRAMKYRLEQGAVERGYQSSDEYRFTSLVVNPQAARYDWVKDVSPFRGR
jgi:hypothetical protein